MQDPRDIYSHRTHQSASACTLTMQKKLIDKTLLSPQEIAYLNQYHSDVRATVGPLLLAQGLSDVYDWLQHNTEPL